jgi:hypothetical protein
MVNLMNIAGLICTTGAALLMYFYPPLVKQQYWSDGRPILHFVNDPKPEDKAPVKRQVIASRAAPLILALGFGLTDR